MFGGAGSVKHGKEFLVKPSARRSNPNPSKGVTLRNMASVTIKRLPGGAVAVSGRRMNTLPFVSGLKGGRA
jgi:hypothetical protein